MTRMTEKHPTTGENIVTIEGDKYALAANHRIGSYIMGAAADMLAAYEDMGTVEELRQMATLWPDVQAMAKWMLSEAEGVRRLRSHADDRESKAEYTGRLAVLTAFTSLLERIAKDGEPE